MNRAIKFRAWCYSDSCWLEDEHVFVNLEGNTVMEDDEDGLILAVDTDDISIEQFTGLLDKNGVELFEGDVVQGGLSYKNGSLPHMGAVVYDEKHGSFATKNEAGTTLLCNLILHTLEKIGTVRENPELLK